MVTQGFSYVNGMTLYDKARKLHDINPSSFRSRLEGKGICGLGMFNDQIGYKLSSGQPLTFCYKYGGGEMGIVKDGRVLFIEGHGERSTVEDMINDFEEIFAMPIERRVIGVSA